MSVVAVAEHSLAGRTGRRAGLGHFTTKFPGHGPPCRVIHVLSETCHGPYHCSEHNLRLPGSTSDRVAETSAEGRKNQFVLDVVVP